MPLIYDKGGLLRIGNTLAGSTACCCNNIESQRYAICGNPCAFRVQIDDFDSEMAACEEAVPEPWVASYDSCLDSPHSPFLGVPVLTVEKTGSDCEGYEGIQDDEAFPVNCYERIEVGRGVPQTICVPNLVFAIGGSKSFSRGGYTQVPTEPGGAYVSKQFGLNYYISIICAPANNLGGEYAECPACSGAVSTQPRAYFVDAALYISLSEVRYNPETGFEFHSRYANLATDGCQTVATPFDVQSCGDVVTFEQQRQFDCSSPVEGQCSAVPDYYPDSPLEITLSRDDGVTVGEQTIPWAYNDQFQFGEPQDFPDDMSEPGGITVYLAERCCCLNDDTYCNPLP